MIFRFLKAHNNRQGFTLIELLLVISIIGAISATGVIAANTFSQMQTFNQSVNEVVNIINTAKSKAYSQVKPNTGACAGGVLEGYKIAIVGGSSKYNIMARCSGTDVNSVQYNMNSNVKFKNPSSTNGFIFNVYTGAVTGYGAGTGPGDIVIRGWGSTYTKTINVNSVGVIKIL